jgi:hypothetical protein
LEPDYTEYEPKTTKYDAVLPAEYYLKNINEQSPGKKDKWFVRAHHLESLTKHPLSKVDDVLNTKYYSYYKKDFEDEKPSIEKEMKGMTQEMIGYMESEIDKLKSRLYMAEQLKKEGMPMEDNRVSLALNTQGERLRLEQKVAEIKKMMTDPKSQLIKSDVFATSFECALNNLRKREREMYSMKFMMWD